MKRFGNLGFALVEKYLCLLSQNNKSTKVFFKRVQKATEVSTVLWNKLGLLITAYRGPVIEGVVLEGLGY